MSRHILLVDDDPEDAEILMDAFKNCGMLNVLHLLSADAAFEYLASVKSNEGLPNMIITDNYLPGITGTDFLVKLKRTVEFGSIPVIMLSATRSEKETERFRQMGALDYLSKPSSYEEYASLARLIQTKMPEIR